VVNLTTNSGTNALSGTLFGFLRHESLNARNHLAAPGTGKPLFRRRQVGGVIGGPVVRNHTFFFADYQGQRQKIARTAISTVPTLLQRQGIFTEAIGGRVPVIYDPVTQLPFPDLTIPSDRVDTLAASLIERFPLPTSSGTSSNFRRATAEVADQDQIDARIDHRLRAAGDYLFARFSSFTERFDPVLPLPDGSGTPSGTLGPQHTQAYAFASSYRRIVSKAVHNELRAGDTTRGIERRAARRDGSIVPTYAIAGYQHLGSPPNTETDFRTGVRQVADTLTWTTDRHAIKAGFDLRWSRLDVLQPPSPAGVYQFTTFFSDLRGVPNTGASFASFLLGQVQNFSIDVQTEQIRNRAHMQEYFVQDDWRISDRLTLNAGLRYTLNVPSYEEQNHAAVFDLDTQRLRYLGRDGNPRTARRVHKNNFGPRLGLARRIADLSVLRAGYGVVWIEQAGVTTPFTTPSFPFVQTVSQAALDNVTPAFQLSRGPTVAPLPPTPAAALGQGAFAVDRELGSGYVQQWHLSSRHAIHRTTSVDVAYVGSNITRVGIPDVNLNQLSVEQLALGAELLRRVPNPYFGTVPAASSLGTPTTTVAQLMKPYPQYTTVSLYRNNVGNSRYHGVTFKLEQRSHRGLSYSVVYTRSKLLDDASSVFDASILTGPVASYPVADSFDRRRERDVSTGDIPHVFVAAGVWDVPRTGVTLSTIVTLQSGTPLAVTQLTNFNAFAGFGIQRPNRIGDPALPAGERTPERWFDERLFDRPAIYDRQQLPQPSARTSVSKRRSLADTPTARETFSLGGGPRRDLQPAEHTSARGAEHGTRIGRIRIDYVSGRSTRRSTRDQTAVLTGRNPFGHRGGDAPLTC